jgi:hypothetical protein
VIAGSLPKNALRLVREWLDEHRDELDRNFERVANEEKPDKVEPLP